MGLRLITAIALWMGAASLNAAPDNSPAPIAIDYPANASLFPPDMTPPAFVWRDPDRNATEWAIEIVFPDGSPSMRVRTRGAPLEIGEIDERCAASTNQRPSLTPSQLAARTWTPGEAEWNAVRARATERPAVVHIRGARSEGQVSIRISKDPVGAPIFYRDVPLMPEETQKGVIQPLGQSALPLIAWRLRDLRESKSRLLLEGMPTCANCHSFSGDGKTLAMDLDGPSNDKGLYAMAAIEPRMSIRAGDVIEWSSFRDPSATGSRVGFMSQISPDGKYVVTTVNRSDYVANFKDYRFLQVFYPTRGVLAWYDRGKREMHLLPGADDPRYVQTSAVWSPDGQYLVFGRAAARDPYPSSGRPPAHANDPAETRIQYDLYRIRFNQGRGGPAEPVAGASRNGMSNSFPKISPDGRWLVYVQARNGQLMRPDGQLFIVPAQGGTARRLSCNTGLMNSWHSFSPNGRWLVFSSKSDSPYTRMYLTHLDEQGRDSPAIRIENATAANRAVNLPEFVNIAPDGLSHIEVPAADFYRVFSRVMELTGEGRYADAVPEWNRAVQMSPADAKAHNNLGFVLAQQGQFDSALIHLRKALELNPAYAAGHNNMALLLQSMGMADEAIAHWRQALAVNPGSAATHNNLAGALYAQGDASQALEHWRAASRLEPDRAAAWQHAAWVLATSRDASLRDGKRAVEFAERAAKLSNGAAILDTLAAAYAEAGRFDKAVETARRALAAAGDRGATPVEAMKARLSLYERGMPFRENAPEATRSKR